MKVDLKSDPKGTVIDFKDSDSFEMFGFKWVAHPMIEPDNIMKGMGKPVWGVTEYGTGRSLLSGQTNRSEAIKNAKEQLKKKEHLKRKKNHLRKNQKNK